MNSSCKMLETMVCIIFFHYLHRFGVALVGCGMSDFVLGFFSKIGTKKIGRN